MDVNRGGSNFDIEVRESLFQANQDAKAEFETKFKPAYEKMKSVFENLNATDGFSGKAREGFLETFEILTRFHQDLNSYLPELYETIEGLHTDLENIEQDASYRSLE